jgi:hypothetical protein
VFGLLLLLSAVNSRAQVPVDGKIMTGAEVQGTDTIPVFFLNEVVVTERLTGKALRQYRRENRRNERRDADYARLRYNVYKVYPYAVTAASLLKGVDAQLDKMADKKEKKAYLKKLEGDLNKRFKGELEQFTIQQGIILVKLIDRQTGRNCFSIIQEVKGGFNAVVWQSLALLFSNNLKREYDPLDRDRDIEAIVQEIEAIRKP